MNFILHRALGFAILGFSLTACSGIAGLDQMNPVKTASSQEVTAPIASASAVSGSTIGSGSVKVGLVLPLSAGNGAVAATALRNAVELALSEFTNPDIMVLVKDDLGTAEGAASATKQAIAEGAEVIIGPLFNTSVQAAGRVAQSAGKPMIAFSSDESVAGRGVYLLSFTPQSDVERIVNYALEKQRKSFAVLAPETAYGTIAVQAFQAKVTRSGGQIIANERYSNANIVQVAQRLKASMAGADALFIPEDAANLPSVAKALTSAGIDLSKIQVLGTGVWNQPTVFKISQFNGAVFPSPDSTNFGSVATRYKAKFGQAPIRIATLGFDAAALVASLTKTQGPGRFSESTLTNSSGFAGQDGVFRFKGDGASERALAVYQIGSDTATLISPAPKGFSR